MHIIFILQAFVLLVASESTYFVKPENSSCSSHQYPCLTLDEYASNQSAFFTSDSTFLFLNGSHTTRNVVFLRNVSNILLKGVDSNPEMCTTDWHIQCESVSNLTLHGLTMTYTGGLSDTTLSLLASSKALVTNTTFKGSKQFEVRAVFVDRSFAIFKDCAFTRNIGRFGGALWITNMSKVIISGSVFSENHAHLAGGAAFVFPHSELNVSRSEFINNSAREAGGIGCGPCSLYTSFVRFINNSASNHYRGGAIVIKKAKAVFSNTHILGNSGTAVRFFRSYIEFTGESIFKENVNAKNSSGAIEFDMSSVSFFGNTLFEDNYAFNDGGAISGLKKGTLVFVGLTRFCNNTAYRGIGGAISINIHSRLEMHGSVIFENNTSIKQYGGAVGAYDDSQIEVFNLTTFKSNSAQGGGAIYLRSSLLILNQGSELELINNFAKSHGGGLFVSDQIDNLQCDFSIETRYSANQVVYNLPDCFLMLKDFSFWSNTSTPLYKIVSINDTAGKDGQFLYGGLMDRCHVVDYVFPWQSQTHVLYNTIYKYNILDIQSFNHSGNTVSSDPFTLCFCNSNNDFDCAGIKKISTLRGGRFKVSVLAFSQGSTTVAAVILAKVSETARLTLNQNSQKVEANCSLLSYNMYSTKQTEELVLYPDGPCRDTGLAQVVVNITFKDCPVGFTLSDDHCVCEERLKHYLYKDQCIVDSDGYYISKRSTSKFWIGYSNDSELGIGLILYNSCPEDYCKTSDINISFTNWDIQCAYNHRGLLCGACRQNYSLTFGGSECKRCSNMFLFLLVAFIAAGVTLVAFLSILRLTVASGMINSIILYANIVQANKLQFFHNKTNILTVFIAWMNLDLGISTCFYDGMDAYAQTWLQFAFPLYVWLLISLIIITSRYSTLITKLIGSNPIAVLATLLLMSYMKILKNLIQIYLSVRLDYPNKNVAVWFKDATVPYLESRHLALAVLSCIFTAILFLPYTFLLLCGYKMYGFSGLKCFRQLIMKLKPLIDSYYAPHEIHTRFWPGLLLLVRCLLFIVFSLDFMHSSRNSLLAINVTFSLLTVTSWLLAWRSIKIYENFFVNSIESLVFLNLIILATAQATDNDSLGLTFTLVGIVFTIMIGVIVYQFYFFYVAKSSLWLKFTQYVYSIKLKKENNVSDSDSERAPFFFRPPKASTGFRESLLEEPY